MAKKATFLILDDDEDNRVLERYLLLKAFPGSRVIEATEVREAIDAVRHVHVDGIITDHHLAEHDGPAFIREVRARGLACPVVMVTASSDPKVLRRAYDAGATRVFAGSDYDFVTYFRRQLAAGGSGSSPASA